MRSTAPVSPVPEDTTFQIVEDGRGNRVTIDRTVFAENVLAARSLIGSDVAIYQVVKGDGYGFGVERAVALGQSAGVTCFCAGTPAEAIRIRRLAPDVTILLFTGCPPETLASLAALGIVVSVNSVDAFKALDQAGITCRAFLEVDCGFGRFGLDADAIDELVGLAKGHPQVTITGAYTHFGSLSGPRLDDGLKIFERRISDLRDRLTPDLISMAAATHTILSHPDLAYDAVDPGRLLYGIVDVQAASRFRPVLSEISSRIIQINRISDDQTLTIGYSNTVSLPAGGRTGVFPLGWKDGLSNKGGLGSVLVGGRAVPVIARTLLHSIVDLSLVPEAEMGSEVVLVGTQADCSQTLEDAAGAQGMSPTQLHFQLVGAVTQGCTEARWT